MTEMLVDVPEETLPEPEGLESIRVDWSSGEPTAAAQNSLMEFFYTENQPEVVARSSNQQANGTNRATSNSTLSAPTASIQQDQKQEVEDLF